ncbi:hypothetical protein FHS16_001476 [Paenibacillus endophyticus]|uniref:Uncharacterized protein n=1 Tax=Paenibacillus endophyticus TaxID=1294268 RepID=A0A7W5G9L3_9BACL|nr:hypothetical protein [Paenibacillus endophyticus]MBB3151433.1 hypothetical protein [Paenibacillus endophyticus]
MELQLPLVVTFLLLLGVALFWTAAYVLVIYRGFKDQFCGMPLACICANITWEFLLTFIMPFHPLQQIVTLIWFLLDCVILLQYFMYVKAPYSKRLIYASVAGLLVISFLLHYGSAIEFDDEMGIYSAFFINLLMSILFIKLLLAKELQGQSLSIAYFKMIGTLCASVICFALDPQSVLLMIMYVLIFILDILYILLVYRRTVSTVLKPA